MAELKTFLPETYQSFQELDLLHRHVDELFLHHQAYLMKNDLENALLTFEKIFEYTNQNIKDEEKFLLPYYAAHPESIPQGGAVYFYEREHKLLRREMKKYLKLYSEALLHPGSVEIDIIKIFDDYYDLKDLFDHHDARERVFLFKVLDEIMPVEEKEKILRQIEERQRALLKRLEM
jgi:hypothetical protein